MIERARSLALTGPRGFSWLDGGVGARSFLGVDPDREVRGADLRLLDRVEADWRAGLGDPGAPIWMGWISYDLGAAALLGRPPRERRLLPLCLRRYPRRWIREPGGDWSPSLPEPEAPLPEPAWPFEPLEPGWAPADYRARVERAREYIAAGDTYQVNLSQPFRARRTPGSATFDALEHLAVAAYGRVRGRTPADMGALLEANGSWILSNSPETLLDVRVGADGGAVVRSWPIKGTRPRHEDPDRDRAATEALLASAKDRAEHVMIVDLVRNDLGQLCRTGTVEASPRPELVTLPTVHHLVTEVRGELRPGVSLRELLAATFPGGSITGAPKHRTVEIIDELEGEARGIYCGAILVLEPSGLRVSIPIRTAVLDEQGLFLRSGGGIVADSDPEDERLETLAKALAFQP